MQETMFKNENVHAGGCFFLHRRQTVWMSIFFNKNFQRKYVLKLFYRKTARRLMFIYMPHI